MAVYRDGDDLPERVHTLCFTAGQQRLLPKDAYKSMDYKTGLHARLACPKMYCISVGFYYAKWLEKLDYNLRNSQQRERSPSARTSLTSTPTPVRQMYSSIASSSAAAPSADRQTLMEKRAAIFEDNKADEDLTSQGKIVYKYREERTEQWVSSSSRTTNLHEREFYEQYDEEQLARVKKSIASLNERDAQKTTKIWRWPYQARSSLESHKALFLSFPQAVTRKGTRTKNSLSFFKS